MKPGAGTWIRLACIAGLWCALVIIILTGASRIDFFTVFTIIASAIVVFVPLYKKHFNDNGNH